MIFGDCSCLWPLAKKTFGLIHPKQIRRLVNKPTGGLTKQRISHYALFDEGSTGNDPHKASRGANDRAQWISSIPRIVPP